MTSYRILKRRIGWVLGKSAPEEELAPGMEPSAKIWELLTILLQDQSESSDVAVRLSAALAIRERIDVSEQFYDYIIDKDRVVLNKLNSVFVVRC